MTDKDRVLKIYRHQADGADGGVFWTGHPADETIPIYAEQWGIEPTREAIYQFLGDPIRWVNADAAYRNPREGRPLFDPEWGMEEGRHGNAAPGCFEHAKTVADIEAYPWPDPDDWDFTDIYREIEAYGDKLVLSGPWCPFFNHLSSMFGMENYFIAMYEQPELVEAATELMVDALVAACDKFFAGLGDRADVMFFGNDFGTQFDLMISPDAFRRFVLPSMKRIIAVGKKYHKIVQLHSCGSMYRVIPDLIEAGLDALHPLQALAAGMSAAELAQYKNDLVFVGGIDAQSLFPFGSPEDIKAEVRRVRGLLGPNIIISPSHEEILPNVPAANILAMAQEAVRQF
ncbi:MAG: hypothetical protein LBR27_06175 [Bifidobacteriaceae bacterium]|jgi:uroporphyrinogen decarboxylase|nr:hypothetical protein [Bifidobacteriaceae bacterium]